jgi:hypothetical protein
MNIYKLQYTDKEEGYADLLAKGTYEVIEGEQVYRNGTQAIVYIGQIVEIAGTYDEENKHSFLGHEKNDEGTVEDIID